VVGAADDSPRAQHEPDRCHGSMLAGGVSAAEIRPREP
jgi:hypothetical protein